MPRENSQLTSSAYKLTAQQYRALPKKRRSKFGNVKTRTHDGITHASKKQSLRWVLLRHMESKGEISNLRREIRYRLDVNGHHICDYIADHVFDRETLDGGLWITRTVVEDVKSAITRKCRDYRLKVKLMKAVHNIDVVET
jgi:hypothetical protein